MKLCVLEWVCGGGLANDAGSHLDHQLLNEGVAMLRCLIRGALDAGHRVTTSCDQRAIVRFGKEGGKDLSIREIVPETEASQLFEIWSELAQESDLCLLVAPESDGILVEATAALNRKPEGDFSLVNCSGEFLRYGCNKHELTVALANASVATPPTRFTTDVDRTWLDTVRAIHGTGCWVVKPMDGAGCDGLRIMTDSQLSDFLGEHLPAENSQTGEEISPAGDILQPLLPGISLSCSSMVGTSGEWHWLPLMTQEFQRKVGRSYTALHYTGGALAPSWLQRKHPGALLEKAARALGPRARGWVGFDLVYNPERDEWLIIEMNPRVTSSIVGLQASCSKNLVELLVQAQVTPSEGLTDLHADDWSMASFRV